MFVNLINPQSNRIQLLEALQFPLSIVTLYGTATLKKSGNCNFTIFIVFLQSQLQNHYKNFIITIKNVKLQFPLFFSVLNTFISSIICKAI